MNFEHPIKYVQLDLNILVQCILQSAANIVDYIFAIFNELHILANSDCIGILHDYMQSCKIYYCKEVGSSVKQF